jgi:NAD(P)H dehydrogenase (quinone)
MPVYAVTGASGQLGRLAVLELLSRGVSGSDVVAVVRTPSKAADLAERGVQVREADYSRPSSLVDGHFARRLHEHAQRR